MRTSNQTPTTSSSSPRRELDRRQHSSTRSNYRTELQPTPHKATISTMSNSIDQPYINIVEFHRPTLYQQCRTPSTNRISTMSNSIDQPDINQPYVNNVELHRPTTRQQCRTPSTTVSLTVAPTVNNVELHRQSHCMSSPTMSNSIDKYHRHHGASINNVELRHGELSSCAKHTLNTCNLLSTRPRAASDSKKK